MGNPVPYAELISVLGCVLLSVFFSGSETALNALGSLRLEKTLADLAERGRRHRFLEIWASRQNEALTCILIGNNVVNITASALATVAFESMFLDTGYTGFAIPTAVFVTSFLILTFGEIIPKTVAQNDPDRFIPWVRVLYPFWVVLEPFTWAFTKISTWVIRRSGGAVDQVVAAVTEEDIENHIERAAEQGNLDEEQKKLLSSVIDFDEIRVEEVMKPRTEITGLPETATLQEILSTVEESGYSRYPVYGEDLDDIKGVLHTRDLLTWFGKPQGAALDLDDFVRPMSIIVPESKSIADLLREMQETRNHMAIVVDEHGGTAGLVTVEDIIEEVFGEIYDEYDTDDVEGEDLVQALGDDSWEVEARVSCRDLEDALEMEFPEEGEYSTVAGFILDELGDIPEPGNEVRLDDLKFTVVEADATRVVKVRIDRGPAPSEQPILEDTGS